MESFYAKVRELVIPEENGDEIEIADTKKPKSKSKNLECLYCYEIFTSEDDLISHEGAHRSRNQYTCKWCNVQYTFTGWEYHYRKHNNDKRFKCESCNKSFYMSQQLKSHLSHHKYSCTLCDQTFVTLKQIRSHAKLVHNFNLISDFVGLQTGRKRRRNRRKSFEKLAQKASEPKVTLQLEKINGMQNATKSFNQLKGTEPKKIRRIKNASKSFVCESCDLKFPKMVLLRSHLEKYRSCRPYWCNDCESTFVRKKELEKHVRRHLYKCEPCSLNFSYKCDLDMHCYKKHMVSVFGLVPKPNPSFRCHYCGMNLPSEEELRNHMKLSSEDIIICAKCLDTFDVEDDFKYHLREMHEIQVE